MRINISNQANQDLDSVETYISLDNPSAAINILKKILRMIDWLKTHPYIGRKGRVVGTRELVIAGTPFLIIYRVTKNAIFIVRILHGARKWPSTH